MYVPIRIPYQTHSWSAPKLTPAQEIALGEEIARVGKEPFIKEFLKPPPDKAALTGNPHDQAVHGPGTPPSFLMFQHDHKQTAADKTLKTIRPKSNKEPSTFAVVAGAVGMTAMVGVAAVISPHALALIGAGAGWTVGSRQIAIWKYKRWLNRCLAAYQASQRKRPGAMNSKIDPY